MDWNGQPVMLSRRQERALLYFLAGERKPVSRERLACLLFPEDPESQARLVTRMEDHDLWMAFFEDSEGNTMALMSEVPRTAG